MKVLVIHHLEEIWKHGYSMFNTSFEEQLQNVLEHVSKNTYDKIILTKFECDYNEDLSYEYEELSCHIDACYEYAYGWEKDDFLPGSIEGVDWVKGGNHSELVMLDDWLHELKNCDVDLCGAFDGECIEDIEIALKAVGANFNRLEHLIV